MALKIQLNNNMFGSKVLNFEPIGIHNISQTIKRSATNEGIVYEIVLDLDFIKDGRRFIKTCYENAGGVDAVVLVNIYEYDHNARIWELYFTGQVNYQKYDLAEEKVGVALEQTGVERRVLNLLDRDVDLETIVSENGTALPATPVVDMVYHSKKILKELDAVPGELVEHQQLDVFAQSDLPGLSTTYRERIIFGNMNTIKTNVNELPESFQLPWGWLETGEGMALVGPASVAQMIAYLEATPGFRGEIFRAEEAGLLEIDIVLKLKHEIEALDASGDVDTCGDGALGNIEIHAWIEVRDVDDNILLLEHIGEWDMSGACGTNEKVGSFETKSYSNPGIEIEVGAKVYVYETVRVYADYENTDTGSESVSHHFRIEPQDGMYINLKSNTVAPETTVKTILIHEAFQKMCQHVTNQVDCFYSTLLGRPEIVVPDGFDPYTVDGDLALVGYTNGNLLRLRERPIFDNLEDSIAFTNMARRTAFGFETINGKQVLRLERVAHFYRKDVKILSLGQVANVKKKIATRKYYNQVEIGYADKIDVGQTNAIDEFNTTRKIAVPVVNTKNTLKVTTKKIAAGYVIERQRRMFDKTEDGKSDDKNFVVSVIRDGLTFKTKKNEGYSSITNVYDPESGYNYDLSPMRCFLEHVQTLASSLIRAIRAKIFTFTSGEVNFLMTSQKTTETAAIAENGNIDATNVEPIWDNEIYSFECPLSRDQLKLIKASPYGYIEFSDRFGETMEGFIDNIDHEPNDGKAKFELLRVHRP